MKILTIHASAGAGHTKAAEALHNGVKTSVTLDAVSRRGQKAKGRG